MELTSMSGRLRASQRIMVEYHSRDLLRRVGEILARKAFVGNDRRLLRWDAAAGQMKWGSCKRGGLTDHLNDRVGSTAGR
jgi:hypothetical protein